MNENVMRLQRGASSMERRRNPSILNFGIKPFERRGERTRVTEHLRAANDRQVLVLCAPLGCGKTSALHHFAAAANSAIWDVRSSSDTAALAVPAGSDLLIIDDFDTASPDFIETFIENVISGADRRRYIIVGSSPQRMGIDRLLASGVASIVDAKVLNFTAVEIEALAELHGIACTQVDVERLLLESDGWPLAVHWVVRDAARGNLGLGAAFEIWLAERGHYFLDFIANMYGRDSAAFTEFFASLRLGAGCARERLQRFEALGLPVLRTRGNLRPFRIVSKLAAFETEDGPGEPPATEAILGIKLFGRARFELAGEPLVFVRHRDQAVLSFVALAPDGRCTRASLLEAFWPGQQRDMAAQGLRTTLSRIRSAIRAIVGPEAIDRYFRSHDDVSLDPSRVSIDVQRFLEHVRFASIEDARANHTAAKEHYAAANEMYAGRLLASEFPDPCFEPIALELEQQARDALKRLIALSSTDGDENRARDCAAKLLKLLPLGTRRENAFALFASNSMQSA